MQKKQKFWHHKPSHPQVCKHPTDWPYLLLTRNRAINGLAACWQLHWGNPLLGMLTTVCKQHQEPSTQIGGYFATVGLPFQGDWNTLIVSYHRLLVTQQDIEIFISRTYIVLMFYNAVFFDQWWGHLAMLIGHNRGTKSYTTGMDGFHNWSANLGLKCAYNTIGTWPIILHCCQTTGGSSGFCIGTLVGGEGLDGRKILGTPSLKIFAAWRAYLRGK